MTQDKNEGSENLNWMEIAETDAVNDVRHTGQRLPFIAAAMAMAHMNMKMKMKMTMSMKTMMRMTTRIFA